MMKSLATGVFAALCVLGFSSASQAIGIFDLNNTGVNVSGGVDNSWSIVGGTNYPQLTYPAPAYTDTTNGTFPIGPWVPNTSTSQWDTPDNPLNSLRDPSVNGTYVYQTSFFSIGNNGSISGQFAADNYVSLITLNGNTVYTGSPANEFAGWTSFNYTGALSTSGPNLFDFTVVNLAQPPSEGANPTGLNVDFLSSGSIVGAPSAPEPSTWAMIMLGFLGIGLVSYRRRGGLSLRIV
ncbi:PEP-CTERM sorting domain-containing protein [Bradyrhizobium sp.]|jgi:hypothetical protein|uniref:PEP-CTERM sorting domain-containing protein n=1 Tax=Bradyrhizobium sp. TaxID=376 RepID=UPI003C28AEFA